MCIVVRANEDPGSGVPGGVDILFYLFTSVNVHKNTWKVTQVLEIVSRVLNKNKSNSSSIHDVLQRDWEIRDWADRRWWIWW